MIQPLVSSAKILKVSIDNSSETYDLLAVEEPLEIRIGFGPQDMREQKNISVTMRTPGNDFELALGFLFTEGIIRHPRDISVIKYCTDLNTKKDQGNIVRAELKTHIEIDFSKLQRNFYTTSSCGVCGKASIDSVRTEVQPVLLDKEWQVNKNIILSLPDKLRSEQNVFEYTGGLHACALFDLNGTIELVREDVGRHNALDKLIGASFGKHISDDVKNLLLNNKILLLSGRISFELIQKAAMAGIKMVCAVGAPSSLAIEMAKEFDITLIGFLRESRFNIYCNKKRVII